MRRGGGGFLVGLTNFDGPWEERKRVLGNALKDCKALSAEAAREWRLHRCTVDKEGLLYHM